MTQQDTFDTVPTKMPPLPDEEDAGEVTDNQGTFAIPNNDELGVEGGEEIQPAIAQNIKIMNAAKALLLASRDTHFPGNPTLMSGFVGMTPNAPVSSAEALSWTPQNNPLSPIATFTLEQYQRWMDTQDEAYIWVDHALWRTKLWHIMPATFALMNQNPNFVIFNKSSVPSQIIPGFLPECFSIAGNSLGESSGVIEFLRARKVRRIFSKGICGDVCAGDSAIDLANAGFEVWFCVDGQVSLSIPIGDDGTTTETIMVARMKAAGVHFYKTSDLVTVAQDANLI